MTLKVEQLAVRYDADVAVRPTSFELAARDFVALVGPNGAGKSSLLKALAGILPYDGQATWNGSRLGARDARYRARTVAYLPQTQTVHWPLDVRELVGLGRLPHRAYGAAPSTADRDAIAAAMEQAEVTVLAGRAVDRLSAGERARALLARALAVQAPVLLVDEPIAMLDPYHQLQIMTVLAAYAGAGALVIAVLHDLGLAARFCNRVLLMDGGRVVDDGGPEDVLSAAALRRHYRVDALIASHDGELLVVPWRRAEP
jgi:iron complex transport system ATP-binding protein